MPDIVARVVRSRMMANIRASHTHPEQIVRKGLHARGFRYRLHVKDLPGKPDLVFPGLNAVVFVNGCFWHGHDCHLFKKPDTNRDFWVEKIASNRKRDRQNLVRLADMGWRRAIVWECALKGKTRLLFEDIIDSLDGWLCSDNKFIELRGHDHETRTSV